MLACFFYLTQQARDEITCYYCVQRTNPFANCSTTATKIASEEKAKAELLLQEEEELKEHQALVDELIKAHETKLNRDGLSMERSREIIMKGLDLFPLPHSEPTTNTTLLAIRNDPVRMQQELAGGLAPENNDQWRADLEWLGEWLEERMELTREEALREHARDEVNGAALDAALAAAREQQVGLDTAAGGALGEETLRRERRQREPAGGVAPRGLAVGRALRQLRLERRLDRRQRARGSELVDDGGLGALAQVELLGRLLRRHQQHAHLERNKVHERLAGFVGKDVDFWEGMQLSKL